MKRMANEVEAGLLGAEPKSRGRETNEAEPGLQGALL